MASLANTGGTPHTSVHRLSRRFLEPAQDVLVLGLGVALFGLMLRTLATLVMNIASSEIDFREVIAQVLFMLVMVELLRLLIVYLEEHRVAVDFMLELGIVSTLREIVLRGVVDLGWPQILALSLFILALGALLRYGDLRRTGIAPDVLSTPERPVSAHDGRAQPAEVGRR